MSIGALKKSETLACLQSNSQATGSIEAIKVLEKEFDELMKCEEMWWSQRAKALWLKEGDKNSNFFHQKASQRKDRNWIESNLDDNGRPVSNELDIGEVFSYFFSNIFASTNPSSIEDITAVIKDRVTPDLVEQLGGPFTEEDILPTVNQLKPLAALGPDGLPALCYQKYW